MSAAWTPPMSRRGGISFPLVLSLQLGPMPPTELVPEGDATCRDAFVRANRERAGARKRKTAVIASLLGTALFIVTFAIDGGMEFESN